MRRVIGQHEIVLMKHLVVATSDPHAKVGRFLADAEGCKVLALKERMPGLVVLPAHDPTATRRLLES